ncbi:hypothetical protein EYF80_046528 [Liparis tanakae]|uniref:Uncharacterized protein n=1 Tax=Liparis tanakae TaxID=230148 RepID=A0A4Z2FQ47_9TELE|nr:hypothetical protein EYF80_046528 [Liparis tanakae]
MDTSSSLLKHILLNKSLGERSHLAAVVLSGGAPGVWAGVTAANQTPARTQRPGGPVLIQELNSNKVWYLSVGFYCLVIHSGSRETRWRRPEERTQGFSTEVHKATGDALVATSPYCSADQESETERHR